MPNKDQPHYYVKFAKYNANTLEILANNQVRFSRVRDFNDFNEFRYFTGDLSSKPSKDALESETISIIFDAPCKVYELYKKALATGIYDEEFLRKQKENFRDYSVFLNHFKQGVDRFYKTLIIDSFAYDSVGIFCGSALEVFQDDRAQVMFAHYGDSLRGLALIYESSEPFKKVEYEKPNDKVRKSSCNIQNVIEWAKEDFSNMTDFCVKSPNWEYESEHRLFSRPGTFDCTEKQLTLKSIFYTPRRNETQYATLENINNNVYSGELDLIQIFPSSYDEPKFVKKPESTDKVSPDDYSIMQWFGSRNMIVN